MILSIIITHYNEPKKDIENLFISISQQRLVPWSEVEIHIVEDGTVDIPEELYMGLPCEVYHHHPEHGGIAAARNYGLEQARGDYVMFCDCDDMFLNALGIHLILTAAKENPDLISSAFIEETKGEDGKLLVVRHDNDMTFIHGKAFKKNFLKRESLKFNKDLPVHEDGYFVRLCFCFQKYKKYIETPFYMWCWRDGSICRKKDFVLKTYPDLLKAREALSQRLKDKGMEEEYRQSLVSTFCFCYYDFQKPTFNDEKNGEYIVTARKAVRKYWRKYKDEIMKTDKRDMANAMYACRSQAFRDGMLYEVMTIIQFIHVLDE